MKNDNCDYTVGPCACGAWHTEEEVDQIILDEASKEVLSWPVWVQKNTDLVFGLNEKLEEE